MASRIFLSHSGDDSAIAQQIADALRAEGLEPVFDREILRTGHSFLSFMEKGLSTSDYCLLLWSVSAATRQWVQLEWEAALHRSVHEARAFLVVGRLDEHPLPMLLRPRLYAVLNPDIRPGLADVIAIWRDDRAAERESQRPVGNTSEIPSSNDNGKQVYVTSDLFGITCPWAADLDAPAGVLLDDIRHRLRLPERLAHDGRVGVTFEYYLGFNDNRLARNRPLSQQGVQPKSVLWVESEMKPFAATAPTTGELAPTVFRSTDAGILAEARRYFLSRIESSGLGVNPRRSHSGETDAP
jgi:TIR domain